MQQLRKQLSESDLTKRDTERRNQTLQREKEAAQREQEAARKEKERLKQERDMLVRSVISACSSSLLPEFGFES